MTFWLSAFWYCNPTFTRYACSIVLPYGNLESVPVENFLSLLKSISRQRDFFLVKTINGLSDYIFPKNSILKKCFCLLWCFILSIFISFPYSTIFSIVLKGIYSFDFFLSCTASHLMHRSGCNNSEQVFSPFQTWLVFLFLKLLMCLRFHMGPCSWWMHGRQKDDALLM